MRHSNNGDDTDTILADEAIPPRFNVRGWDGTQVAQAVILTEARKLATAYLEPWRDTGDTVRIWSNEPEATGYTAVVVNSVGQQTDAEARITPAQEAQ